MILEEFGWILNYDIIDNNMKPPAPLAARDEKLNGT